MGADGSKEPKDPEKNRRDKRPRRITKTADPYTRTKAAVYASGNKWAIENFEATHG